MAQAFARFDRFVLKEDSDLRGRQAGDVVALQRAALSDRGVRDDQIDVVHAEGRAVRHVLDRLESGDLVVILVDDVRGVLETVRPYITGTANI